MGDAAKVAVAPHSRRIGIAVVSSDLRCMGTRSQTRGIPFSSMSEGIDVDGLAALRCRWFGVDGSSIAVVVIGGSGGGLKRVSLQARQYAGAGVSALAVGYHGFDGRPELANIALEGFGEAIAWVCARITEATASPSGVRSMMSTPADASST